MTLTHPMPTGHNGKVSTGSVEAAIIRNMRDIVGEIFDERAHIKMGGVILAALYDVRASGNIIWDSACDRRVLTYRGLFNHRDNTITLTPVFGELAELV